MGEKLIERSDEQCRKLIENALLPAIIISIKSNEILYVSSRASELYMVSMERAVGRSILSYYDNQIELEQLIQELIENGFVKDHEICLKAEQKREYWTRISGTVIQYNKQKAAFLLLNDTTDRKHAVEILKQNEERFRILVEKAFGVILLRDQRWQLTYVSPSIHNVLGYTVEEFFSVDQDEFTHPDCRAERDEKKSWILAHPGESISFISCVRHKDGTWRWIETRMRNLLKEPRVWAMVTNFHDITERKETENELQIKSRGLEEMNTALSVLLEQRERDRNKLEDKIVANVKELVLPYVDILKQRHLDPQQRAYLDVLETNLKNILSPFMQRMTSLYADFTPMEVKVANLIRDGKTVKEIAGIFGLSETSVHTHRQNVRNKLGLKNQKTNLCTYLMPLK